MVFPHLTLLRIKREELRKTISKIFIKFISILGLLCQIQGQFFLQMLSISAQIHCTFLRILMQFRISKYDLKGEVAWPISIENGPVKDLKCSLVFGFATKHRRSLECLGPAPGIRQYECRIRFFIYKWKL